MPIYEYQCRDCGERFEYLVRGEDKPKCPACGGRKLDKQISAASTHTRRLAARAVPPGTSAPAASRDVRPAAAAAWAADAYFVVGWTLVHRVFADVD